MGDLRRLFAYAPVVVAERAHEQIRRVAAVDFDDLLDRDATRLGLGLLEQPSDRVGRVAHGAPFDGKSAGPSAAGVATAAVS